MGATAEDTQIATFVPTTAKVLILTEDRLVRARIVRSLETHPQLDVRVSADLAGVLTGEDGDLLVWHLKSIGTPEVDQLTQLKRNSQRRAVVLVADKATPRSARRASDAGVDGLVLREQLESAIGPTVGAVLAGQTVSPGEFRPGIRGQFLSYREKQVLGMVVMGFTNSEIGSRLFLAESTVKSHLSSAFSKLGVRSRSEASAMILDPEGSLGTGILAITGDETSGRGC